MSEADIADPIRFLDRIENRTEGLSAVEHLEQAKARLVSAIRHLCLAAETAKSETCGELIGVEPALRDQLLQVRSAIEVESEVAA